MSSDDDLDLDDDFDPENLGPADPEPPTIAIEAHRLHHATEDEAIAEFEEIVGTPDEWGSQTVRYRMGSEWQRDWVIEVGHWLHTAKRFGFAAGLHRRLNGARKELHDAQAQGTLHQELAALMTVHYFTAIGWSFGAYEPPRQNPGEDIDVILGALDGTIVDQQVKGSGPHMRAVLGGLEKAAGQLPQPARRPSMIVMCSKERFPLSGDPHDVTRFLIGGTVQNDDGRVVLDEVWLKGNGRPLGKFREWPHVGAVALLDYRRGVDRLDYGCTVILNPWANPAAACHRDWIPRSRVLHLDGTTFRWMRGAIMGCIPDATAFVAAP